MHSSENHHQNGLVNVSTINWTARITAILSLAFMGLFVVAHLANFAQEPIPTLSELGLLALFPFGCMVGLVTGFRFPLIGGAITVGAVLAFYGLEFLMSGSLVTGPYFILCCLPGFLFLLAGLLQRNNSSQ